MIHQKLINPKSIAVIGGSDDIHKPGGKVLKNLIDGNFKGQLYVVNPKLDSVQGIKSFRNVSDLPETDLAIIAIAAKFCPPTVNVLADEKQTRGFIILSAGFSEENEEGAAYEHEIVETVNRVGGSLIGPNCIGVLNQNYTGIFTSPIPKLDTQGCDFISGSGATAVFIMEAGIPNGLTFSSVYSVGNSAQMGVEDVLKYLDKTFDPEKSSKVKLLYLESIKKPDMLLKHAASLIRKGCKIAAIKAGGSEAGSRAASSHTGALAKDDLVVHALLRKAGIVRCFSREELTLVGSIFMHKELQGKNIAIITHAGGPAVMLTDALSNGGLSVPKIEGPKADALLEKLFPGSSVSNPIDFLATGTAEQLGHIIDACENDFDHIDAMCVIFGSPGLFGVSDVYDLLDKKMKSCKKPIYPILPSVINVKKEINEFIAKGRINFPDEVSFGSALAKIYNTFEPQEEKPTHPTIDSASIRNIIDQAENGYLAPEKVQELLDAAGIPRATEAVVDTLEEGLAKVRKIGFPVAMKVVGPIHKTDVGGVKLNVASEEHFACEFERMIQIPDTTAILIQPMLTGIELFVGAKNEERFGHMVVAGLGGIFIEVLKDVIAALTPLSPADGYAMISDLRSHQMLEGIRGQEPVNKELFAEIISRVAALCMAAPEIFEMDLNPLLGKKDAVVAVDARIRIEK
jgi:acetyltransferase